MYMTIAALYTYHIHIVENVVCLCKNCFLSLKNPPLPKHRGHKYFSPRQNAYSGPINYFHLIASYARKSNGDRSSLIRFRFATYLAVPSNPWQRFLSGRNSGRVGHTRPHPFPSSIRGRRMLSHALGRYLRRQLVGGVGGDEKLALRKPGVL